MFPKTGNVGKLHWWYVRGEESGIVTLVFRWRKPVRTTKPNLKSRVQGRCNRKQM